MFLECGRKFNTEDLLEEHVKRRHPDYYKDRYAYKIKGESTIEKRNPKKILDDLENKIKEIENNAIVIDGADDPNEIKLNLPDMKHLELYNEDNDYENENEKDESEDNDFVITDEMLLIGGKYSHYDELDEVMFIPLFIIKSYFT
jgi:hypothetical protein